jgi:hypothetical protein
MISPYRNDIRHLRENVVDRIEDVDYSEANECFDKLGLLYFKQHIFTPEILMKKIIG